MRFELAILRAEQPPASWHALTVSALLVASTIEFGTQFSLTHRVRASNFRVGIAGTEAAGRGRQLALQFSSSARGAPRPRLCRGPGPRRPEEANFRSPVDTPHGFLAQGDPAADRLPLQALKCHAPPVTRLQCNARVVLEGVHGFSRAPLPIELRLMGLDQSHELPLVIESSDGSMAALVTLRVVGVTAHDPALDTVVIGVDPAHATIVGHRRVLGLASRRLHGFAGGDEVARPSS